MARWAQCEVAGQETAPSIRSVLPHCRTEASLAPPSPNGSASVTGDETAQGAAWKERGGGCEAAAGTIIKSRHQSCRDLTACLHSRVVKKLPGGAVGFVFLGVHAPAITRF